MIKCIIIVTAAVALLASQTAHADRVKLGAALRCRHVEPLDKWLDSDAQFMQQQLNTKECSWVPKDLLVEIKRRSGEYVCVRVRGSDETCQWMPAWQITNP